MKPSKAMPPLPNERSYFGPTSSFAREAKMTMPSTISNMTAARAPVEFGKISP